MADAYQNLLGAIQAPRMSEAERNPFPQELPGICGKILTKARTGLSQCVLALPPSFTAPLSKDAVQRLGAVSLLGL